MKKMYQLGLIAALVALLPAGMLFAGNGNGEGEGKKNSVSMTKTSGTAQSVTFTVYTPEMVAIESIDILPRDPSASIKEINPVLGGFEVVVDFVPVTNYDANPNNDDVIIFDIVGVDNITGVDGSNNNDGTHIQTNISEAQEGITSSNGNNGQGNGIGCINPSASTNLTPAFSSTRTDINIFPNPVVDETNVVTVGEILGKTINIMDLTGKMVLSLAIPNSRSTVLNLSQLNPGLYILNYETEDGKVISKRIQKI